MLRGRRGDGAPVAPSRARPSSRSDKSRGGSRGWWFSGWRGGGSSSKRSRKAASREALRRRAERRVYKPASFLILFKLACMYVGLTALLYSDFSSPRSVATSTPAREPWTPRAITSGTFSAAFPSSVSPSFFSISPATSSCPPCGPSISPIATRRSRSSAGSSISDSHRRRRGNPNAARRAVEVAVEVLSRTLPSTLWEVEVITEDDTSRLASANIREFVLPPDRVASAAAWTRGDGNRDDDGVGACELLSYGVERSTAGWGDWVVHMGADAILNQRAVDAVVAARRSRIETGGAVAGVQAEEPTRGAGRGASRDHAHGQRGGGWGADDVRVDPRDGGGCSRG